MNLFTLLDIAADAFTQRVAVVQSDTALSFAQLRDAARHAAARLALPRLAYLDITRPALPVALFAAARAGVPFIPLNYRLTTAELQALLARIAPATVIMGASFRASVSLPPGIVAIDTADFLAQSRIPAMDGPPADDNDDLTAFQLFTSGTTGQPKAATLTHGNLSAYITGTVEFASAEADEATLITVPPYHIAGLSAILSAVYAGRRMIQMADFDAVVWLDLVKRQAVSSVFVVPTMLARIVDHLDRHGIVPDLPALRAIAYGGGGMPAPVIARAMDLFARADFTNAYGLTETSSTIALLGPDDHRAARRSDDPTVRRRLHSVGRALPSVEIEIRDADGHVLPPGQSGLVFVRGDQVGGQYRDLGDMRDHGGWFPTRDRGFLDDESYLFLEGRDDDVIVRGGENISPGEIEGVLIAHPAIQDVAAIGVSDRDWGEAIGVALVMRPAHSITAAELREAIGTTLRSSKIPQHIKLFSALPYSETGKLLRRVVRQQFAAQPDLP